MRKKIERIKERAFEINARPPLGLLILGAIAVWIVIQFVRFA